MDSNEIIKKLKNNQKELNRYKIRRIGLFGSYRRGKQNKESDVDILVEFKPGEKTFDNYMGLKSFSENLLDCEVDLVIKEAVKPDLKKEILGSVQYAWKEPK